MTHAARLLSAVGIIVAIPPSIGWWRALLFTASFIAWTWAVRSDAKQEALKRYEQTRAYLIREGYIDA